MSRTVTCVKLGKEAPGLERQTYPGDLGKRVYDTISAEAWQMWMGQQTILINEFRLSVMDPAARQYLEKEMQRFLFEEGDYIPEPFSA